MPQDIQNQVQKEQNSARPRLKVFCVELLFFLTTMLVGTVTAVKLKNFLQNAQITLPVISAGQFFFSFLFLTVLLLIVIWIRKKVFRKIEIFFKIIFISTCLIGGFLVLALWVPEIIALAIIFSLILWWFKKSSVALHNILIILGISGVGSDIGLRFEPGIVVLFLALFSVYDFIAVYKTKHMVSMARAMIETGTILGFIIPGSLEDLKVDTRTIRTGGRFLILGGGDVVFPLILAVSMVPEGILKTTVIVFSGAIGLFLSFWIFASQKTRNPIPALPPIALTSVIGFFVTLLI